MRILMAVGVLAGMAVAPAVAERAAPDLKGPTIPVMTPHRADRIMPANPKTAPTTGTDLDGVHGYICRTMIFRREDGGLTKIRRCAD
jgi:hypothetical protein